VHSLLVSQVFPRQAEVIDVAGFGELLGLIGAKFS
jgi:hypothetical protein